MGALFNIMAYSMGSMLLGVVLTLVGVILMFLLIKGWWRDSTFTPVSFCVGAVLFVLLAFQSVLICGAVTIKSYSDDAEAAINAMVAGIPQDMPLTTADSQKILDHLSREWPLVGYYVGEADFRNHTPATIARSMIDELRSCMNYFILRRVGWSLFFIVLGAVAVIKTISYGYASRRMRSARSGMSVSTGRDRAPRRDRTRVRRRR